MVAHWDELHDRVAPCSDEPGDAAEDVVEVFGGVGLDVNESSIGTTHKGGQQDVWSLFCKLKESENSSIFIAWLV